MRAFGAISIKTGFYLASSGLCYDDRRPYGGELELNGIYFLIDGSNNA